MEGSDNTQPTISTEIVIKVKLLTNEVYEISTSPDTLVAELKRLISAKTNVPVERQRLVFAGKQLVDNQPVSSYIKESGLTIHLIARQQQAPENQSNTQQQPQQPTQQQQPFPPQMRPPQGLPPPFSIFSMMGGPQPATSGPQPNPNVFAQNINTAVNNLMGNLGIRLVPGPIQPPQPPQNGSIPSPAQQQPTQPVQPQQEPSNAFNPNSGNQLLEQLQHSISRVNLPPYSLPNNSNPREYTIQYLRRLQNNMLRFIPQLNRGIQLLQEGRTTHLPEFINIFEALSNSNTGAIEAIRALTQPQQQQHNHQCNDPTHHHHHQHQHHQQPNVQPQPANNEMQNETGINATIIIAENDDGTGNGAINVEINNQQGQANIINAMSGFLQPGSGFNFANLFAPRNEQQPPQPQQQQSSSQNSPSNFSVPQPNQNISPQSSNANNQPQQSISPPNNNNSLSPPSQNPQAAQQNPQLQNALGGVNIMSVFNNLQQSGGMGALLGMSLGSMLEEQNQPTTVYSAILTPVTGGQILTCFTQKDFSFIGRKREAFREATLKAISVAGSREELVKKYAKDTELLLMPEGSVRNEEVCGKRVNKILHKHIEKIVGSFLDSSPELNLTEAVMGEFKAMFNESIEEISKHTEGVESVFANIKRGFIQSFDQLIPGFSGMLYSIIERDMVRIYREYAEEKKRRQEMSEEEAKDEAELLKKIELQASEDVQGMAAFEHSQYYPQRK